MDATNSIGIAAIINTSISLACIVFSWWVLINIKLEKWLHSTNPNYVRMLVILLSIAIGHQVASFLINYLEWSRLIGQTFF